MEMNMTENNSSHNLNQEVWFRFVKVVYLFSYLVAIGCVSYFAYGKRPIWREDKDYHILCHKDGKVYDQDYALRSGLGGLFLFSPDDTYEPNLSLESMGLDDGSLEGKIRRLCEYGAVNGVRLGWDTKQHPTPQERNFSIKSSSSLSYVKGGWFEAAGTLLAGLVFVFLTLEIIKRVFFYVVLGRGFFENPLKT